MLEHKPIYNTLIRTFPIWFNEYEVNLDVKPLGIISSWGSIIHLSKGGNNNIYGDRIPAIWFQPGTNKLHICSAISNNRNYCVNENKDLPRDRFTKIRIAQVCQDSCNDYRYTISIDGEQVHSILNKNPITLSNVRVYMADPWGNAANALVKNLSIETSQGGTLFNFIYYSKPTLNFKTTMFGCCYNITMVKECCSNIILTSFDG